MPDTICYDPRDWAQVKDDPSTWKPTRNPVLKTAAKAKGPRDADYWRGIAALANLWDEAHPQMPRASEKSGSENTEGRSVPLE
jgi:hypothetical protein